jgi:hypothetical protein
MWRAQTRRSRCRIVSGPVTLGIVQGIGRWEGQRTERHLFISIIIAARYGMANALRSRVISPANEAVDAAIQHARANELLPPAMWFQKARPALSQAKSGADHRPRPKELHGFDSRSVDQFAALNKNVP